MKPWKGRNGDKDGDDLTGSKYSPITCSWTLTGLAPGTTYYYQWEVETTFKGTNYIAKS